MSSDCKSAVEETSVGMGDFFKFEGFKAIAPITRCLKNGLQSNEKAPLIGWMAGKYPNPESLSYEPAWLMFTLRFKKVGMTTWHLNHHSRRPPTRTLYSWITVSTNQLGNCTTPSSLRPLDK